MSSISTADLESRLEGMFAQLPGLPTEVKDLLVNYGPYLCLIGGVITILSSGIFNLYTVGLAPIVLAVPIHIYYASMILSLICGLIFIVAFKPLRLRQLKGWRTLFYLALLYSLVSLLSLNILEFLVSLVFFYVLFQIKSSFL